MVTSSLVISLQLSSSTNAGNASKFNATNDSLSLGALNHVSLNGTDSLLNSTVSVRNGTIVGSNNVPAFYGFTATPSNGGFMSGFDNTSLGMRYPVIEPYSSLLYNGSEVYSFVLLKDAPVQTVMDYLPLQYFPGNVFNYEGLFSTSLHFVANFT
ncbi:MAG: hypothetical protein QXX63_01590 [Thermoplasmatales archaeon]